MVEKAIAAVLMVFLTSSLILRYKLLRVPIWSLMMFASLIAVASGLIRPDEALRHVDLDVIFFLIGMFCIASLASSSGLLELIAQSFVSRFKSTWSLAIGSSILFGLLSSIAVNDTVALLGAPLALFIARAANISAEMMCLLLMLSITIGSVMTPIGNPQNMLIAIRSGMSAPFVYFVAYLALPTLLNLFIVPLILLKIYKVKNVRIDVSSIARHNVIRNVRDAVLGAVGLAAAVISLAVNDVLALLGLPHVSERGLIPLLIASALVILSSSPRKVLEGVDWGTILFFVSMFITMDAIWSSGVLQELISRAHASKLNGVADVCTIALVSLTLSQLLSNVPFTKLYIDYMHEIGYTGDDVSSWLALSTLSTIAGNLTILGAASNVIVLEALESRYGRTVSFTKFLKVGSLVTLVNTLIYMPFLLALARR